MSQRPGPKQQKPTVNHQPLYRAAWRVLATVALLSANVVTPGMIARANGPAPGTVIENQATGSFVDPSDGSTQTVESNIVQVTVAEVAGIAVVASGSADDGEVNPGDVISFDFTITNVGNDPTQFFIPGAPSAVSNGSAGTLQIVAYDPDGAGTEAASQAVSIDIPGSGFSTGDAIALDLPNGAIPPGGTVTVRVPVTVNSNATNGSTVSVTFGNTTADVNGSTQNQPYVNNGLDIYTQDNADTDTVDSSLTAATETEATGSPINAEREASASQSSSAIVSTVNASISGTLFEDTNRDDLLTGNEPRLPAGITVRLLNGNNPNIEVATAVVDANGQYSFPTVANGDYIVQVDTATVPAGYLIGTLKNIAISFANAPVVVDFPFDTINVAGTVFEDFDGSNAQNGSEFGLQGITVSLFQDLNNDGNLDISDDTNADGSIDSSDSVAITVTDSDGNYGFNVADGNYLVLVDSADSSLGNRPYGGVTNSPNNSLNNPRNADVSGASVATDLDFPYDVGSPPDICNGEAYTPLFFNNPTLVEGSALALNAVYRFPNVTSGLDALVKITSLNNGAILTEIDGTGGEVSALQPSLDPSPNTDSSVDLEITFVAAGTTAQTAISSFSAAGLDIDGDGDAAGGGAAGSLREYIELTKFSSYRLETPTTLTASYTPPTGRFESTTTQFQPGISVAVKQAIAVGDFENVSQFRYRVGAIDTDASTPDRLNSLFFGCIEFDNQNTATTAYAISGTLYRDDDGNDSFNNGESTLPAGITVDLLDGSDVVATTITDSSGQYTFTSVTNGTYSVRVKTDDANIPNGTLLGTPNDVSVTIADATPLPVNFGFDTIPVASDPNILLVKRITAINRGLSEREQLFDNSYVDVDGDPNDNETAWPGSPTSATIGSGTVESYLSGITGADDATAISGITVRPGDEIEYTIPFLSNGDAAATNVLICDRIPTNTTFIPTAFNSSPPAGSGSGDRGILLEFDGNQGALTNINDGDEIPDTGDNGIGGYYFPPAVEPSTVFPGIDCGGASNDDGIVLVDLSSLPNATGEGVPPTSYGFVRFRVVVE